MNRCNRRPRRHPTLARVLSLLALLLAGAAPALPADEPSPAPPPAAAPAAAPRAAPTTIVGWTGLEQLTDATPLGSPLVCPFRPGTPVLQVLEVAPDSPAARAGLRARDYVAAWNGAPPPDLLTARRALLTTPPGALLRLTVLRREGDLALEIAAAARPLADLVRARAAAAAAWLAGRQTAAGAWAYAIAGGAPAESAPVSALVFYALAAALPVYGDSPGAGATAAATRAALERGSAYLWKHQVPDGGIDQQGGARYRNFATAFALLGFLASERPPAPARLRPLCDFLRAAQVRDGQGLAAGHPALGGWNYKDSLAPEDLKVDITVTAWVLDALAAAAAAGVPADPAAVAACRAAASGFLASCHNLPEPTSGAAGAAWLDGGFYTNARTSKAGEQEVEVDLFRFRSYGSATADGLRALRALGAPADDPRVVAARTWLRTRFDVAKNPGFPPESPVSYEHAIYYYYLISLAKAFDLDGAPPGPPAPDTTPAPDAAWGRALTIELLARQKPNGTWQNPNPLMGEDEPAIATAMALLALDLALKWLP